MQRLAFEWYNIEQDQLFRLKSYYRINLLGNFGQKSDMQNILVPTDFSENANNAVEYAAVIAQACGATITLLNVYTPAVSRFSPVSPLIAEEVTTAKIELQNKLQVTADTVSKMYPTVQCHVKIGIGETVDGILYAISSQNPDIVIMGTQGASSIEKVLLGSNASKIIEMADCPVLVIPAIASCHIPKKIVFATDYSYRDVEGAKLLTALASIFGAAITVVHIATSEEDVDDEQRQLTKFTDEFRLATNYQNIHSRLLTDNTVIMGLDTILQNSPSDLIALSTRRRNIFEKLYNPSLTKKLVRYTQIPLLAFKIAPHKNQ